MGRLRTGTHRYSSIFYYGPGHMRQGRLPAKMYDPVSLVNNPDRCAAQNVRLSVRIREQFFRASLFRCALNGMSEITFLLY